jgi:general secretion pathway protein G
MVTDGYLRSVPKDPITNSTDTWQTVPSEPDPANPTVVIGIVDVKSGAEGTSLDGRPYAEF